MIAYGERRRERERAIVDRLKEDAAAEVQLRKLATCAIGYKVPPKMAAYAQEKLRERVGDFEAAHRMEIAKEAIGVKWEKSGHLKVPGEKRPSAKRRTSLGRKLRKTIAKKLAKMLRPKPKRRRRKK